MRPLTLQTRLGLLVSITTALGVTLLIIAWNFTPTHPFRCTDSTLAPPILSFPEIGGLFYPSSPQAKWSRTFTAGGWPLEDCRVDPPFQCAVQPGGLEAQVSYEVGPLDPQNQTWQVSSVVRLFSCKRIVEVPVTVRVINPHI